MLIRFLSFPLLLTLKGGRHHTHLPYVFVIWNWFLLEMAVVLSLLGFVGFCQEFLLSL